MTHWHKVVSVALAVGLFATLPVSAQPGSGGSVEDIEAQLTKLRAITKSLEAKLASAKENAKAEKGKLDEKGRHGFGHRGGPRGPMHGFGSMGGDRGGFGSMHGPWSHMRGMGEQAPKAPADLKRTIRSKEAPKSVGASGLEKKLDQIQKDLEEIRRELRRR